MLLAIGCSLRQPPPPLEGCADMTRLICTGLYGERDLAARRIAAGVESYEPAFRLWSDGLEKARYVYLPPGSAIDTSNMDNWVFPVGTKLWKEFSWHDKRIETRFMEKLAADSWRRTTFVWTQDQTDAREDRQGRTITLAAPPRPYDIPGDQDCARCHGGRRDGVLGFEALAMSDADAQGFTLARLEREGRLTRPPKHALLVPGSALERAALGWLHMNCGVSCHNANPEAAASFAGLNLKLGSDDLADPMQMASVLTTVNRPTTVLGFRDATAPKIRVVPGHPEQSAVYVRTRSRLPSLSMPPLATHAIDEEALATLSRWIVMLDAGRSGGQTAAP